MSKKISSDELEQIWGRWRPYGIHPDSQKEITELVLKVNRKIVEMIQLYLHSDYAYATKLRGLVNDYSTIAFLQCYYIGYELASGKMNRADGTAYLMAATAPLGDFASHIQATLVLDKLLSHEAGQSIGFEISTLIADTANEICILGINNYAKIKTP